MWHWGDVPPFFINLLVILNNPFEILFDVKTRLSSILLINIFNLNNYFLLFNIKFKLYLIKIRKTCSRTDRCQARRLVVFLFVVGAREAATENSPTKAAPSRLEGAPRAWRACRLWRRQTKTPEQKRRVLP